MAELELVRLHEDGENLVLRAPDGTQHTLPVTDALRASVRHDRPQSDAPPARAQATLRPRDLQARLRAGASAEELAAASGLPVEHVQRYEWPVVAEREHVIGQVRAHRIDGEPETTLGEAADARLAARGVAADDASWSARREGAGPWTVEVRFTAGERERSARWTFDPRGRVVRPLDDEARWLGQPDDPLSPEMVGVPSIADRVLRGGAGRRAVEPAGDTGLLLDDLAGRRGQRPGGRTARPADDEYDPDDLSLTEREPAHRPPTGATSRVPGSPESLPQLVSGISVPWTDDDREAGDDAPHGEGAAATAETPGAAVVDLRARRQRGAGTEPDRAQAPRPGDRDDGQRRAHVEDAHRDQREQQDQQDHDDHRDYREHQDQREHQDHHGHGDGMSSPDGSEPVSPAALAPEPAPGSGRAPAVPTADRTRAVRVPIGTAATTATGGAGAGQPRRGTGSRRPGRKGRAQVPSWDEIVFGGARPPQ